MQVIEIATAAIPEKMLGKRIERIHVKVGKLSAVVPDSLRFCFDIAAKASPLGGAELIIDEISVTAACRHCRYEWVTDSPIFVCPKCESGSVEIKYGRELNVHSIEIEE